MSTCIQVFKHLALQSSKYVVPHLIPGMHIQGRNFRSSRAALTMGYSKIHLRNLYCGISFNIGRVRKFAEPLRAASSPAKLGHMLEYNFVHLVCGHSRCPAEASCLNLKKTRQHELIAEGKLIQMEADLLDVWVLSKGDEEDCILRA